MVRCLLAYDASLIPDGGKQVFCKLAGAVPAYGKEAVGWIFHDKALRQAGLLVDKPEEEEQPSSTETTPRGPHRTPSQQNLEGEQIPEGVNWKGSKKSRKVKKKTEADLYELLGLQHERWTANDQQIKNGYRKACLLYHPDKKSQGVEDEDERRAIEDYFKQIQEAYETLSDPAKRREYDSVDTFDDSLPSECAVEDFFKVFGPAFRRNSRWSVDSAVPELGDESTSYEEVQKFYDFWYTFKSWREFPHPDEEDVEGAESREHKRWIERNNSKLREKAKKDEGRRLREFVEASYRQDPRILQRREEERQERERKKQEKEEAKRRAIEEEARLKAEEEERKRAEEEEARRRGLEAKRQREADKKAVKKERSRLRQLCAGAASEAPDGPSTSGSSKPATAGDGGSSMRLVSEEETDRLCSRLDLDAIRELCDGLEGCGGSRDAQGTLLRHQLQILRDAAHAEAGLKEQQKAATANAIKDMAARDHAKKLHAMREWSDEELRLLDKATGKFPQGTPKRWEQVTAFIRTRTLEEVLLMVKERQGASSTRLKQQEDWKGAQKRPAEVKATADLRDHAFTDVQVKLSVDARAAATAAVAPVPAAAKAAPAAAAPAAGTAAKAPAAAPAVAPAANGTATPPPTPASPTPDTAAAPDAATAPAAAADTKVVSAESGEWTETQEVELVKALKRFGKERLDRWDRVAELVPGKTKAQCAKRFKELKEVFKSKKK